MCTQYKHLKKYKYIETEIKTAHSVADVMRYTDI